MHSQPLLDRSLLLTKTESTRRSAEHIVRTALRVTPPSECYWLVNASPVNYGRWVGQNYGPIFRRGPKFTGVYPETRERSQFATPFSDCRYLVPFWRYSRSKCDVVRNRIEKVTSSYGTDGRAKLVIRPVGRPYSNWLTPLGVLMEIIYLLSSPSERSEWRR